MIETVGTDHHESPPITPPREEKSRPSGTRNVFPSDIDGVKRLAEDGIADEHRNEMWVRLSEEYGVQREDCDLEYSKILDKHQGEVSFVEQQIEQGVEQAIVKSDDHAPLRRLLTVMAYRNPSVGYSCGINHVGAMLLRRFVDEKVIYWIVAAPPMLTLTLTLIGDSPVDYELRLPDPNPNPNWRWSTG